MRIAGLSIKAAELDGDGLAETEFSFIPQYIPSPLVAKQGDQGGGDISSRAIADFLAVIKVEPCCCYVALTANYVKSALARSCIANVRNKIANGSCWNKPR